MSVPCGTGAGGGGEESPVGNGRLEVLSLSVTNASFQQWMYTETMGEANCDNHCNSLSNALENQTDTCLFFKKCFVSHVRQTKTIWKWIKDRLTSLVASTQWAGRARDDGQLLNSVIGWERGMSVFMMCVHCCGHLAVCVHCLPSTFVVTQRRERTD